MDVHDTAALVTALQGYQAAMSAFNPGKDVTDGGMVSRVDFDTGEMRFTCWSKVPRLHRSRGPGTSPVPGPIA